MPLVLVKEDGTGLAGANAYANVADGDDYHLGHLYASAWTGASAGSKAAALVFATRLIDALSFFYGVKTTEAQALQWPRVGCPDRDRETVYGGAAVFDSDALPKVLVDATCETARALLVEDRTANPLGEGLKFSSLADLQQSFDKSDRRPMIPRLALSMLGKLGTKLESGSGTVRLLRG